MPSTSFSISPQFIEARSGRRFVVLLEPAIAKPRANVLFVPPFTEEMNKSRRTVAMQARDLAADGCRVAILDLAGCGDSEGEFEDADWDEWRNDVESGLDWLASGSDAPLVLWGLRLGALLACEVASRRSDVARLMLWQPVLNGEQHIDQFLRIELAGQTLKGDKGLDRASLWNELREGRSLHVAGSELTPQMAQQVSKVRLGDLQPQCPVIWIDVAAVAGSPAPRPAARVISQWSERDVGVEYRSVAGPFFWRYVSAPDSPDLLRASTEAMRG